MGEKTGDRRLEKEQRRAAAIEKVRSETYQIRVYCQNCGAEGREDIPVGTPIAEHACPVCGCFHLRKTLFAGPGYRSEASR